MQNDPKTVKRSTLRLLQVMIAASLCVFLTWLMTCMAAADSPFGTEPMSDEQPQTHFWLNRPFADEAGHPVEHTFLYGSLGTGRCGLHTGVDIRSTMGIPVLAGAAGQVIYAGDDSAQLVGPLLNYYGKLVLLKAEQGYCTQNVAAVGAADCEKLPVYVLYAHLDRVSVKVGQFVRTGDILGSVGMTGIAMGPHLHLEVRVGDIDLMATRNPSLWLKPRSGYGVIVGKLLDATGNLIPDDRVLIYRVEGGRRLWRVLRSYPADLLINVDSALHENFVLTDVPSGEYELVAGRGASLVHSLVTVKPDRTSFVELIVSK